MNVAELDVRRLVPHSGPMLLIDEVIRADEQSLEAACVVRSDGLFALGDGRVPAMLCDRIHGTGGGRVRRCSRDGSR